MTFLLLTFATVVRASLTSQDKAVPVGEVPTDSNKSHYASPSVKFEDAVVSIDEVQSSILVFLDHSDTLDYRQVSRALRGSVDANRSKFVLASPGTIARRYPHLSIYRASISRCLSQRFLQAENVSSSFAASVQKNGTLRLIVTLYNLEDLSTFPRAFWEQFQRLELVIDSFHTSTVGLLSTFEGLQYDLVLKGLSSVPEIKVHIETLLTYAQRIKYVYLCNNAEFDQWKPHAHKTDIVSCPIGLIGNGADDVIGFFVDRVRDSQLVWIANQYFPDMSRYLEHIDAFDLKEYSGQGGIDADAFRKYDRLEAIHVTYHRVSLDDFLKKANPNISHTLTKITADNFSIPEGLSDAAVGVLRSVTTLIFNLGDNMDLRLVDQLPYLEDLQVRHATKVRLPRALGASNVFLREGVQLTESLLLTAETLSLSTFHPFMEFENTKSLNVYHSFPNGSLSILLDKLPRTLEYLAIVGISDEDCALLKAALQEGRWSHLEAKAYSTKGQKVI